MKDIDKIIAARKRVAERREADRLLELAQAEKNRLESLNKAA